MKQFDEYGLQLIKLTNSYAKNMVFWDESQRNILKKFIDTIDLWLKIRTVPISKALRMKSARKRKTITRKAANPRAFSLTNANAFEELLGLSNKNFAKLLTFVEKDLKKCITNARNTVSPQQQLSLTLRYLATGDSYKSLQAATGISHSYMVYCIPRVCQIMWKNMQQHFLKFPNTCEKWLEIADNFKRKWQFPLCLGALSGKHIRYNVSGAHNMIILALTDADAKFLHIDVNANSPTNEQEILRHSALQTTLDNAANQLPPNEFIGSNRLLPHVIIGNNDFALQKHLLTPFAQTLPTDNDKLSYNKRLLMASQVSERAFSILSARFRILHSPINLKQQRNVELITKACFILHNFLMSNSISYKNVADIDAVYAAEQLTQSNAADLLETAAATKHEGIRHQFMKYFCKDNSL